MTLLQAIFLGVLQGITEFLPISSSGHLVLAETILNLKAETLKSFDVALHVGSLLAILIYFRGIILEILTKKRNYILYLVIGTLPAVIVGLTLEDYIDQVFRSMLAVGIVMIITGFYFLIAEKIHKNLQNKDQKITIKKAILIGVAQMFALVPGISRSGSTIATGVITGMERTKSAEFSFLLGSIAISGAGLLTALKIESLDISIQPLMAGFIAAAITSYFSVKFLMHFFKKNTLKPFAYYLFAIGILAIVVWFDVQSVTL
ncbi:undecaprenyl-diphosphate phosphatase [Candidatus Peregrinibacteria bacterium CG10_big_fil_rev_8_21_14_0_10_44_7]|nr:MAG: undecaprenyl-diphosphate phosphatase [Candidatus Peregrinibacteria bacterium CG10_big_fil_rev_8_21_14_0_10_44_7]